MKVYKVVHKTKDGYFSAVVKFTYRLYYKIGKETIPIIGKIFIFPKLTDAITWYNNSRRLVILECETDDIEEAVKMSVSALTDNIKNFWTNPKYFVFKCPVVYGTAFVSKLTPIREVIIDLKKE